MNRFSYFAILLLFVFAQITSAQDAKGREYLPAGQLTRTVEGWRPVTQAELDMKTPVVEADADAEAIFWEVSLDDKKRKKLFYNHYVRVKIFTERGRERFSKIDIPFVKDKTVEDVAARVIKPNGTIIELKANEIFQREIISAGKIRVQAKSFAIPGIEPGVIVEYRYKETFKNDNANGERLVFQRDIPVQRITYFVRPTEETFFRYTFRNMPEIEFTPTSEDFYVGTLTNVKALRQEPKMPPEDEVRAWVQLSYGSSVHNWDSFSIFVRDAYRAMLEPTREIQQKADELTKGVSGGDEKIRRIFDFTRTQIRNLTYDPSLTDEQRQNIEIKNPADTLKRKMGHEGNINFLFAALVKAAGLRTALVMSGDRSESFSSPDRRFGESRLHPAGIAIMTSEGQVIFVNAGNPYLPFGKLHWFQEDSYALLVGEVNFQWGKLPLSPYIESSAKRTGKFKLLEDGTLEGEVRLEYDGHQAIARRMSQYKDSPAQREEKIKEEIKARISMAEFSNVLIYNFDDSSKPLIYTLKIRIPNYAQKTGKRLFLQPGFFEYGATPLFTSATRVNPVYFEFPWFEDDSIEIELPKGFLSESADAPGNVFEAKNICSLSTDIRIKKDTNLLTYKRRFYFGNGTLLFPAETYPALKMLWDKFQKSDSHTITLKQSGE